MNEATLIAKIKEVLNEYAESNKMEGADTWTTDAFTDKDDENYGTSISAEIQVQRGQDRRSIISLL